MMPPLQPTAAAVEAARYLDLDPAFFLEQAALNGMLVFTDGKLIHLCLIDEETVDGARVAFLWQLMKSSKSGQGCAGAAHHARAGGNEPRSEGGVMRQILPKIPLTEEAIGKLHDRLDNGRRLRGHDLLRPPHQRAERLGTDAGRDRRRQPRRPAEGDQAVAARHDDLGRISRPFDTPIEPGRPARSGAFLAGRKALMSTMTHLRGAKVSSWNSRHP